MKYNSIYDFEPFWGSWSIDKYIGSGSSGEVYKITKTLNGKKYISALKYISVPTKEHELNILNLNKNYTDTELEKYYSEILQDTSK